MKIKQKIVEAVTECFAARQYKKIAKILDFKNAKTVLDVGGSSGIFARQVKRRLKNIKYFVLEIDRNAIKKED